MAAPISKAVRQNSVEPTMPGAGTSMPPFAPASSAADHSQIEFPITTIPLCAQERLFCGVLRSYGGGGHSGAEGV